jgi:hypothetical protein
MIQITKSTKKRRSTKVLETHDKNMVVTLLNYRNANGPKYTEMFIFGSDYRIEMDEQTLKSLYVRIGEVLEGK